jgi:hypothetical protein
MNTILFYVPLKIHQYGNITIASEKLRNLGLCSALRAFIVPHLCAVSPVSSEGLHHSVASSTCKGMWRTYSNPNWGPSDETGKTQAVSQQVWHDKDPSLLKAPGIGQSFATLHR